MKKKRSFLETIIITFMIVSLIAQVVSLFTRIPAAIVMVPTVLAFMLVFCWFLKEPRKAAFSLIVWLFMSGVWIGLAINDGSLKKDYKFKPAIEVTEVKTLIS